MVQSVTLTLNEPLTIDALDDSLPAAGSLLGSLVIVARNRGVQLSKEQLVRDHQLTRGDATVKELIAVARAEGLRATATRLRWRDLFQRENSHAILWNQAFRSCVLWQTFLRMSDTSLNV